MPTYIRANRYLVQAHGYTEVEALTSSYNGYEVCTRDQATYILPDEYYLYEGDYTGAGLVGVSNMRTFEQLHAEAFEKEECVIIRSAYSYRTVAIALEVFEWDPRSHTTNMSPDDADEARVRRWRSIHDSLSSLADYPVLDDDDHSQLQCEAEEEDWEKYAQRDFVRAVWGEEEDVEDMARKYDLRQLYSDVAGRINSCGGPGFEHTSEGVCWETDDVGAAVTDDDLEAHLRETPTSHDCSACEDTRRVDTCNGLNDKPCPDCKPEPAY